MQWARWLLIFGVSVAAITTTACNPTLGVTAARVSNDGKVEAWSPDYVARDYEHVKMVIYDENGNVIDHRSVETHHGTYVIEGPNIVRNYGGTSEIAYSASYLRKESNKRAQIVSTNWLGERVITTEPYSISYDHNSDTIVVALGLEGAVTRSKDGAWTRVAVGQIVPSDFSFTGKMRTLTKLLVTEFHFIAIISVVSLSFISLVIAMSIPPNISASQIMAGMLAVIVAIPVIIIASLLVSVFASTFFDIFWFDDALAVFFVIAAYLCVIAATLIPGTMISQSLQKIIGESFAGVAVVASILTIVVIRYYFDPGDGLFTLRTILLLSVPFASLNAISSVLVIRPRLNVLGPIVGAFAGMYVSFAICFSLWYWAILPQVLAQTLALCLMVLVSVVLLRHLERKREASYNLAST